MESLLGTEKLSRKEEEYLLGFLSRSVHGDHDHVRSADLLLHIRTEEKVLVDHLEDNFLEARLVEGQSRRN